VLQLQNTLYVLYKTLVIKECVEFLPSFKRSGRKQYGDLIEIMIVKVYILLYGSYVCMIRSCGLISLKASFAVSYVAKSGIIFQCILNI